MADEARPELAQLQVLGSGGSARRGGSGLWGLLSDGTAAIGAGGAVAGGFFVESLKSFLANEPAGRWWFVLLFASGLAVLATGFWLRSRARQKVRIGIVVTAHDPRRGVANGKRLDDQAEAFSRENCTVTLRASLDLPGDGPGEPWMVEALADQTLAAATLAERLAPDAVQLNLIPTMPLHVGFWFGARLGHTHPRGVVVHAIRQADGAPPYFPATALRVPSVAPTVSPLTIERLMVIDGADQSKVAVALDLQGRGDQFRDQVAKACSHHNIGYLLVLRSKAQRLNEDQETFDAVVEQTCTALRGAALPVAARVGHQAIFLSGPVAISVALGARLAAPETGRWTAFTWDRDTNKYEPFPANG